MKDEFEQAIRDTLLRDKSIESAIETMRRFKAAGLSRTDAYDALQSMRSEVAGLDEDWLLELMDIVAGFCSEHRRVWSNAETDPCT